MPRPRPRLPPVTITLRIGTHQLSGFGDGQRRNKVDRGGHFVGRQTLSAEQQDVFLKAASGMLPGLRRGVQNDIGNHEGSSYRVLPGAHERHSYVGMLVNHRLDFLRVYFESSHIDNAISPPDEIVAIPAQLNHIARIHKAVRLTERLSEPT